MTQRLLVRAITSIGACEEGDNELSKVLFWKAKPVTRSEVQRLFRSLRIEMQRRRPSMSRKDIDAEILRQRPDIETALQRSGLGSPFPGPEPAAAAQQIQKALDYSEARRTIEEIRKMMKGTPMPKPEGRTSAVILAEVSTLVTRIQKSAGEPMTKAQARAEVWQTHRDLAVEVRKARAREKYSDPVTDGSGKTITDRVREVINEATRRSAWQPLLQGWGDGQTREQIIAKVRVEVWRSPEGEKLRDLDRAFGSKPYTPRAFSEIRKMRGGERFSRALNLLDSGIWEQ